MEWLFTVGAESEKKSAKKTMWQKLDDLFARHNPKISKGYLDCQTAAARDIEREELEQALFG